MSCYRRPRFDRLALAASGAIFLIPKLDQPFSGLIGISSEPMLNALHQRA